MVNNSYASVEDVFKEIWWISDSPPDALDSMADYYKAPNFHGRPLAMGETYGKTRTSLAEIFHDSTIANKTPYDLGRFRGYWHLIRDGFCWFKRTPIDLGYTGGGTDYRIMSNIGSWRGRPSSGKYDDWLLSIHKTRVDATGSSYNLDGRVVWDYDPTDPDCLQPTANMVFGKLAFKYRTFVNGVPGTSAQWHDVFSVSVLKFTQEEGQRPTSESATLYYKCNPDLTNGGKWCTDSNCFDLATGYYFEKNLMAVPSSPYPMLKSVARGLMNGNIQEAYMKELPYLTYDMEYQTQENGTPVAGKCRATWIEGNPPYVSVGNYATSGGTLLNGDFRITVPEFPLDYDPDNPTMVVSNYYPSNSQDCVVVTNGVMGEVKKWTV